jgi:GntP family gluconate:H+ symporter
MDSLVIIALGIATVITGVMLIRLHAFLALIAGAFVIASLTPPDMLMKAILAGKDFGISYSSNNEYVALGVENGKIKLPKPGYYQIIDSDNLGKFPDDKILILKTFKKHTDYYSNSFEVRDIYNNPLSEPIKFGWVTSIEDSLAAEKVHSQLAIDRVAVGFGNTFTQIGIMIAMAAILGQCMLLNGSALKIVMTIRETLGERYTALSFVACSFILAIPVYFDTVFYLMLPLAKAMAQQTKKDYLKYVISIVVGGTLAHSLVPPTPGPLLVAEKLDVNIATMFLMGSIVSILGIIIGYFYMNFINRLIVLPIPETEESSTDPGIIKRPIMPPIWLAILPILFPVFTIGMQATWEVLLKQYPDFVPALIMNYDYKSNLTSILDFWGDKNISLATAAIIGMFTTYLYSSLTKKEYLNKMQEALADGGLIILITCAGGALGEVIRQTDIVHRLSAMSPTSGSGMLLLWMAFLVTGVIRIAQGSATVSMLTSVGIFAPLASSGALPYHSVYLALAIGCGSKLMPWMNDSGFWLVGRMSGMTEAQTFKSFSILLTIMGFAGFFATLTLASFYPLK